MVSSDTYDKGINIIVVQESSENNATTLSSRGLSAQHPESAHDQPTAQSLLLDIPGASISQSLLRSSPSTCSSSSRHTAVCPSVLSKSIVSSVPVPPRRKAVNLGYGHFTAEQMLEMQRREEDPANLVIVQGTLEEELAFRRCQKDYSNVLECQKSLSARESARRVSLSRSHRIRRLRQGGFETLEKRDMIVPPRRLDASQRKRVEKPKQSCCTAIFRSAFGKKKTKAQ